MHECIVWWRDLNLMDGRHLTSLLCDVPRCLAFSPLAWLRLSLHSVVVVGVINYGPELIPTMVGKAFEYHDEIQRGSELYVRQLGRLLERCVGSTGWQWRSASADDDLCFLSTADYFVPSAGGFSALIHMLRAALRGAGKCRVVGSRPPYFDSSFEPFRRNFRVAPEPGSCAAEKAACAHQYAPPHWQQIAPSMTQIRQGITKARVLPRDPSNFSFPLYRLADLHRDKYRARRLRERHLQEEQPMAARPPIPIPIPIRVFMYEGLGYSLADLLRCHRERADDEPRYMAWCVCASGGSVAGTANASTGHYGDAPWVNDLRGGLASEIWMYEGLRRGRLASLGVHRTLDASEADLFFIPAFAALSWSLSEASVPGIEGLGRCAAAWEGNDVVTTHESRMLGVLTVVEALPHFAAQPHRHFLFGAAEFGDVILNFGRHRHVSTLSAAHSKEQPWNPVEASAVRGEAVAKGTSPGLVATPSPSVVTEETLRTYRPWMNHPSTLRLLRLTRQLVLINVERGWGQLDYFRSISLAPYSAVGELLTSRATATVGAELQADRLSHLAGTPTSSPPPSNGRQAARRLLLYFRGSAFGTARGALLPALMRHVATNTTSAVRNRIILQFGGAHVYDHSYSRHMLDALFCLVPSGHTCSTRRYVDAVAAGCIPVLTDCLSRAGAATSEAFPHLVDHEAFSVRYPAATITLDPGRFVEALRSYAGRPEWLRSMRHNLSLARKQMLYAYVDPLPSSTPPPQQLQNLQSQRGLHALASAMPHPMEPDSPPVTFGGGMRGILEEVLLLIKRPPAAGHSPRAHTPQVDTPPMASVDPASLFTWARFDLFVKLAYADAIAAVSSAASASAASASASSASSTFSSSTFATSAADRLTERAYLDHVRAFNNFRELCDRSAHGEDCTDKRNATDFTRAFISLVHSLRAHGYRANPKEAVPVHEYGAAAGTATAGRVAGLVLCNGAHRAAAAMALGLRRVPTVTIHEAAPPVPSSLAPLRPTHNACSWIWHLREVSDYRFFLRRGFPSAHADWVVRRTLLRAEGPPLRLHVVHVWPVSRAHMSWPVGDSVEANDSDPPSRLRTEAARACALDGGILYEKSVRLLPSDWLTGYLAFLHGLPPARADLERGGGGGTARSSTASEELTPPAWLTSGRNESLLAFVLRGGDEERLAHCEAALLQAAGRTPGDGTREVRTGPTARIRTTRTREELAVAARTLFSRTRTRRKA